MKIKAKWGFRGDASKLETGDPQVRAGQTLDVEEEYAHILIGKGLAEEVKTPEPKVTKPAAPKETK